MSGNVPNPHADFQPNGQLLVFESSYSDDESEWTIELLGNPEVVQEFAKSRPFELSVKPLSKDEADSLREQMIGRAKEHQHNRKPSGQQEERPTLSVRFRLDKLKHPNTPHLVHFVVDPNPPYAQWFNLQGSDTTANVSYDASPGEVWISMYSNGQWDGDGPNVKGEADIYGLFPNSAVYIYVGGAPNTHFTLDGDIVIYD